MWRKSKAKVIRAYRKSRTQNPSGTQQLPNDSVTVPVSRASEDAVVSQQNSFPVLTSQEFDEELVSKSDDDVFELALEYNHNRRVKETMDVFKLVEEVRTENSAELKSLRAEVLELKVLLLELKNKK